MQKTPVVTTPASVDKEKGKGDYKSPPKKRRERSHSKHRSRSHSRWASVPYASMRIHILIGKYMNVSFKICFGGSTAITAAMLAHSRLNPSQRKIPCPLPCHVQKPMLFLTRTTKSCPLPWLKCECSCLLSTRYQGNSYRPCYVPGYCLIHMTCILWLCVM